MIVHCTSCHHERQAVSVPPECDWCGSEMEKIANDYIEDGPSMKDMADSAFRTITFESEPACDAHCCNKCGYAGIGTISKICDCECHDKKENE